MQNVHFDIRAQDTLTGSGCRGGERRLLAEQVELQTHFRMLERQSEPRPERTEQQPIFPPQLEQSLRLFVFFCLLVLSYFFKEFGSPSQTHSVLRDTDGELVSGCCWGDVTSIRLANRNWMTSFRGAKVQEKTTSMVRRNTRIQTAVQEKAFIIQLKKTFSKSYLRLAYFIHTRRDIVICYMSTMYFNAFYSSLFNPY